MSTPASPYGSTVSTSAHDHTSTGIIAGSVVGGVIALGIIALLAFVIHKGSKHRGSEIHRQPQVDKMPYQEFDQHDALSDPIVCQGGRHEDISELANVSVYELPKKVTQQSK
ncbi:uncharacterized protein CC84DRAFT_1223086 [Paraphaeosphaeria sporulosa]|uniref:Uncharacterized protein n=1 Tax=Paraphaeosphaeria sporulosa TaxID=1460663 RepID=A0A177BVA9_9PLEO|nr:uncharacterized protein CC84DRAFT_1223086 [Paraphaeosphaeria sporulosa]OAF99413.1 hypothetical protein CC84DRAFT_1223086 [Paraphaeosphaeria sporulosa]